jgi:tetratricopeptide (TPR) repeat protein
MAEAAHLFELVADCEEDPDRRADATASLARALYLNRDLRRANPLLELAASRLRERGRTNHARRLEVHRVEGLAGLGSVPPSDLLGRLDVIIGEARAQADWEAVALAQDTALRVCNRQGDVDGILKVFDGIRATADSGSDAAVALCHAALAMQALFGDPDAGLRSARLAVTLALASNGEQHRLTALMRLLVVLQHQGRLFLPEAQEAIEEARALAERSGDLRARFNLEGNLALALIDAGELDQAETLIRHADRILGSADLDVPRLNHTINHAELALARRDFELAERCYRSAEALVLHNGPAFVHDAVGAGLGICALETGNLSEARRREQDLGQPVRPWFYDPTTILSFRARLMELRGDRPAAIALLVAHAADLEGRLVFAWLKIIALLSRMQLKDAHYDVAAATAHLGAQCASTLRLPRRVEELTGIAERAAELSV